MDLIACISFSSRIDAGTSVQVLTPGVDLAAFVERIGTAPERVLMLDYDGTLAPFHVEPARAVPYPEVAAVLEAIVQAGRTRVVLVSGRPAEELPPLLALTRLPEIWGAHGWERLLPDGSLVRQEPAAAAREALARGRDTLPAGAKIEDKHASIAVHWRGLPAPTAASLCEQTMQAWSPLVRAGAVEVLPFDGGLELRAIGSPRGRNRARRRSSSARTASAPYRRYREWIRPAIGP